MALIKDKYSTGDILTAVDMNEIVGQVIDNGENVRKKVDIDQGTENAGKALVINEEGKVAVGIAAQPVDKTLKNDGEAADAKVVGDSFDQIEKTFISLAEGEKEYREEVVKSFKAVYDNIGMLSQLTTDDKSSLVAAINEATQSSGSGSGPEISVKPISGNDNALVFGDSDDVAVNESTPTISAMNIEGDKYAIADVKARYNIAAHAGSNDIHVTSAQKTAWDSKASQDDLDDLRKEMEGYEFRTVTEKNEAYSVDVPSKVMPFASVNMIGGKSVVWNQQFVANNSHDAPVQIGSDLIDLGYFPKVAGHKYLVSMLARSDSVGEIYLVPTDNTTEGLPGGTLTVDQNWRYRGYIINTVLATHQRTTTYARSSVVNGYVMGLQVFDLTILYGAGSEPTTVEQFRRDYPAEYYPHSAPTIKSADVKSIKGKNSITIPSSVRNLDGYGWSAGNVYNYIDLNRKVFVQKVGRVDLGTHTWGANSDDAGNRLFHSKAPSDSKPYGAGLYLLGDANLQQSFPSKAWDLAVNFQQYGAMYILTDTHYTASALQAMLSNVYLYYELATPIETPIDLPSNILQVEPNGTILFEQEDGTTMPVPSEISYIKHIGGDI